ncbi:MAG: MFS transporter [Actinomycetes bacterium]
MTLKELFGYRYVKRFHLSRFISNFGNGISPVALAFGILHLPNGSASELGWVLGSATITMILMSPFGGVIADKYGRVRMVGLCDTWGAIGLLVQVGFFATGNVPLWVLLAANINFGLMWGIWWPAFSGVLPAIVPEEGLQKANAVNQFVSNIAYISGAAAAGFLVSAFGSTFALAVDAISFLVAGLIVLSFSHVVPARVENQDSMLDDLKHGWKVFLSFRWIVVIVFGFSFVVMCWAAGENVLGPLIALKHFDGAKSWGFVLTAESVGYIVGSLLAMRLHFKYPMRALTIISSSMALYLWVLARPMSLLIIAFCAFLWGVTLDLWGSIWSTALQRMVPREALSRVSSFDALGTMLFRPVGLAVAAPLAGVIGITRTLEIASGISLFVIFVMLCVPEVRDMQFVPLKQDVSGDDSSSI